MRVSIAGDLSVTTEVDGVEVRASIHDCEPEKKEERHKASRKTPQHRKTSRRIPSSASHDTGEEVDNGHDDAHIPTVHDLAKSFLETEPPEEKEELETAILSQSRTIDESITSIESDESAVGTGNGLGLPAFLAGMLQNVVDKLKVHIKNVNLRCNTNLPSQARLPGGHSIPVSIILGVGSIEVDPVATPDLASNYGVSNPDTYVGRRRILIKDISLDMLCDAPTSDESPHFSPPPSPVQPTSPAGRPSQSDNIPKPSMDSSQATLPSVGLGESAGQLSPVPTTPSRTRAKASSASPVVSVGSTATSHKGRFADADEDNCRDSASSPDSSEIRAGEDSNSYTSRRSQSSSDHGQPLYSSLERSQDMSASIEAFHSESSQASLGSSYPTMSRLVSTETPTGESAQTPIAEERENPLSNFVQHPVYPNEASGVRTISPEPDSDEDDMAQSVMLSREQADHILAQSMASSMMFESAVSHRTSSPDLHHSPTLPVSSSPDYRRAPGYFPEESYHELSQSTATIRSTGGKYDDEPEDRAPTPTVSKPSVPLQGLETSGSNVALPSSPPRDSNSPSPVPTVPDQIRKRLVSLDTVEVRLPTTGQSAGDAEVSSRPPIFHPSPHSSVSASTFGRNMPGTFSAYADMSASRRLQASHVVDQSVISDSGRRPPSNSGVLDIDIGTLDLQVDISAVGCLHQIAMLAKTGTTTDKPSPQRGEQESTQSSPRVSLRLKALKLALLERMVEVSPKSDDTPLPIGLDQPKALIRAQGRDITLGLTSHTISPDITFAIRRLTAGTGNKDLLSFPKLAPSQHDRADSPDILIKIQRSKFTLQGKPIVDVRAWLRPISIDFDLLAIDESLGSFGGLSGVMELSASVLSSGSDQTNMPPSPPRRGVRFEEDTKPADDLAGSPEIKLNVHLQGAIVALTSRSCSLELECSTVKFNSRPNLVLATVSSARLYEKSTTDQRRHSTSASMKASRFVVNVKEIKLEYLPCPEDFDLERFLNLITPSNDKYENDDDILVDTLLRQRRKGAIVRVKIASILADARSWSFIGDLQLLGDELNKFAAVAKYLPEDDRPGPLIFPRITELNVCLPVNDNFGVLEVSLKEVQVAQIGLPALMALSIGSVRAGPLGGENVVHEFLRPSDQPPMMMMRMIGDEVEPTVKIKLFNLCVEYSVPTIVALLVGDTPPETDNAVNEIDASILSITGIELEQGLPSPSNQSEATARPVRRLGVDVLLHDCAIGLQPHELNSKGVFVLSDTKLSTVVPPEDTVLATLELRRASLHITDQVTDSTQPTETSIRPVHPADRVSQHLVAQGFVSVSSIMSAKAVVNISKSKVDMTQCIEVEVRDELFLLETCADSTQTLISILNGLSPPAPPRNEPKFRTEVTTMQDMVASFTGNAINVASATPEPDTIFDADETSPPPEADPMLESSIMTNSLYGLAGGEHDLDEGQDLFDDEYGVPNTIESFLEEEDYYEISDPPIVRRLNDSSLWESIQTQHVHEAGSIPARLKSEYTDGQEQFGNANSSMPQQSSQVLGSPHRFNTAAKPFPSFIPTQKIQSPFQLHVRDVHIIWNLYDGYDWEQTRTTISEAVEEIEQKLEEKKQRRRRSTEPQEEEESVIGDFLFNSIYIGVGANPESGDLSREISRQISRGINDLASESESYATSATSRPSHYSASRQGRQQLPRRRKLRLRRSKTHKIAFELKGVSLDFFLLPPGSGETLSSVDVRLRDFEIFDNVPTSTWRKFLTYHYDEENMREMKKPMIHIELLNVQPVPDLAATELLIKVCPCNFSIRDPILTSLRSRFFLCAFTLTKMRSISSLVSLNSNLIQPLQHLPILHSYRELR